uniref:ABC transporter domain-containing protein n=1 Tax=Triparma pacifica TaxID=91992 RepID=A0A7S2VVU3_9STRA
MLLSHAAVSAAISQADQGRSRTSFFTGTDIHSDAWGQNGPTQQGTGTTSHVNARQVASAAWPVLSESGYIKIERLPEAIKEAAANSGGDLNKIDHDVYEQLVRYVAGVVLVQLYPGCVVDDGLLTAFAGIALVQAQVVSPVKFHSLAGLFPSDTLRISRGVFGQWVEAYFGEERMAEICAARISEEGLTVSECAMALADSTWVNTLKPLLGLTVSALTRIYSDLEFEAEAYQKEPEKWLIEMGRYASPVEMFTFVSSEEIVASFGGVQRTYAAGEGVAIASIAAANADPAVFQDARMFSMQRADIGKAMTWNALHEDIDSGQGTYLLRVCPAYRFALRMITSLVDEFLPDEASMNALSAGLPLKTEKYVAYTAGELNIGAVEPTSKALWNASSAMALLEAQNIINGMDKEEQACLFTNDVGLTGFRAGQFFTKRGTFQEKTISVLEEDIVMRVPGLGVYYGIDDSLEYASIMASSDFNKGYHTFLQQMLQMEKVGENELHVLVHMVSAWENFTRVSTPIYDNMYGYAPCSTRIREWNLTFEELPNGVNPTFDYFVGGAYTDERLCQEVMKDCTGEFQQFESQEECESFYGALPKYDQNCLNRENGVNYALQGNTTLCRFLHHFMMHSSPELHCFHAGKGDRPDAHGNFKCVPEDCLEKEAKSYSGSGECNEEEQFESEMRLVSVIPWCIDAVLEGKCVGGSEEADRCAKALRQFGLAGPTDKAKGRAVTAASCRGKMSEFSNSVLLRVGEVDATSVLALCSEVIDSAEMDDLLVGAVPSFNVGKLVGGVKKMLKMISAEREQEDGLKRDLQLIEVEAIRAIANTDTNGYDSFTDSTLMLLDTFGTPENYVPFVGGELIQSHKGVLEVMRDEDQLRSVGAFNRQPGQFNSPSVGSDHTSVMLSTKSEGYEGSIRMYAAVWPMLGTKSNIVLPKLPEEMSEKIKEGKSFEKLEAAGLQEDMALWFIEANLDHLFPNHQGITDSLKGSLVIFLGLGWQLTTPRVYHEKSGHLGADAINIARQQLALWIEEYFGEERMQQFSELRGGGLEVREISLTLTDILWTNVFAAVGRTVANVANKMKEKPCENIDLYEEDRKSFVMEAVRLDPPVEMISFLKKEGDRIHVQAAASITASNRDPTVFASPLDFNPKRRDLHKQLSWNALESDIQEGKQGLPRVCPAHDYSLRMTIALINELLPEEDVMPKLCHEIHNLGLFDLLVNIVNMMGFVLAGFYVVTRFLCMQTRFRLKQHCEHTLSVKGMQQKKPKKENVIKTKIKRATGVKPGIKQLKRELKHHDSTNHIVAVSSEGVRLELRDVSAIVKLKGLRNLGKGKKLLDDVNVSFKPGLLTAVMGGSGAGKSTLLNVASMRQESGITLKGGLRFGNTNVKTSKEMREFARSVGFVPQMLDLVVDELLTAAENLYFQAHLRYNRDSGRKIGEVHGEEDGKFMEGLKSFDKIKFQVTQVLEMFDLLEHANTTAKDLSGGQRRRLAIAIECLRPAPIMFLDEPTTGQDSTTALGIVALLQKLARGGTGMPKKTIVIVIHQPRTEIFNLIDHIVLVAKGCVVYNGPRLEAKEHLIEDASGVSVSHTVMGKKLHQHTGNLADELMDIVVGMKPLEIKKSAALVREREHKSQITLERSLGPTSSMIGQPMAQKRHRLMALTYKRHWGTSSIELILLLGFLPVVNFVICALPNYAATGGSPEAQELIVQVLLSWIGPLVCVLGCFFFDMPSWMRFLRWCQHSCILRGDEAVIDAVFGYLGYASIFIMPTSAAFVYLGFSQIADTAMVTYVVAFMEATCLLQTLVLVSGMALMLMNDIGTLELAVEKLYLVRFLSLMYLSFGSTFGGLLYGIDKIPSFYKYMSYASTGFWSNTGILSVVLRNQDLTCNSPESSSDVGQSCDVNGNLILAAIGVSEKYYIPTGGMVFLCCGILMTVFTTYILIVRPWHKPLKIMGKEEQMRDIEEHQRDFDQEAICKDVGVEFLDLDDLGGGSSFENSGSGSIGSFNSTKNTNNIEMVSINKRDSSFSFGASNPMR